MCRNHSMLKALGPVLILDCRRKLELLDETYAEHLGDP